MKMTETTDKAVATAKSLRDEMTRMGRDMWYASLGAMAMIEERGRDMFDTLVEKGKSFPMPERSAIEKVVDKAQEQVTTVGKQVEDRLQDTTKAVLHRIGMPSHAEIQALIARIEQLNVKVEALSKHSETA